MQKELDMWADENKEHRLALKREQRFVSQQFSQNVQLFYRFDTFHGEIDSFLFFTFL